MPWHLEQQGDQWCVVKDATGTVVPGGCHAKRSDAVRHQAALYANESRVAALYDELDRVEEAAVEEQRVAQEIRVIVEQPEALTAAVAETLELVRQQLAAGDRINAGLLEALRAAADVTPQIVVEPTPITVEAPVVNVTAPSVQVEPPNVNVEAQVVLPAERREVAFERDSAGRIIGAVVEEG